MPSRESHELALMLIAKAEGDESILDKLLDDTDVPDDALGFHLQQATEKRLKAVLTVHEIEYDRTHSVSYLTALLEHHGIDLPECREQIEELTPWAVAARYDDTFEATLDRTAARELAKQMRDWSQRAIATTDSAENAEANTAESEAPRGPR